MAGKRSAPKPKATPAASGRKYTKRQELPEAEEAKLATVSEAFDGHEKQKEAVAYGRKVLKVAAGLRATAPPQGVLDEASVARIYELLGVERPSKATAAPAEDAAA